MAKSKTPYFPLWANDILVDEKLRMLNLEEIGTLFWLWAKMWRNPYKRGHLLLSKTKAIPDKTLAYDLKLKVDKFLRFTDHFLTLSLLKKGRYGEYYSEKMAKYKTKWELEKEKQQLNGNKMDKKQQ